MDQYSLVRVIGEGSFGRALLVRPVNDDETFVIKEIRLPMVINILHCQQQSDVY